MELQTLVQNTEDSIPGGRIALRELLEDVDKQIIHIKINMVEHPPRRSTGRLHDLKEEIWPRESASGGEDGRKTKWEEEEELREREWGVSTQSRGKRGEMKFNIHSRNGKANFVSIVGARNDDQTRKESTSSSQGMENKQKVRFILPERQATPIHPSLAIQAASIKRVFAWLTQYNEAMEGEDKATEEEEENRSVVSLDGIDVERPKLDVKLWTRVKTALSSSVARLGRSNPWSESRGRKNDSEVHESTNGDRESGQRSENANSKNSKTPKEANRSQREPDLQLLDDPSSEKGQNMGPRLSKARERAIDAIRTMAARRTTTSPQDYSDDESSSSGSFLSSRASEINLGSIIEKSRPAKSENQSPPPLETRKSRRLRATSAASGNNQTAKIFEHLEKHQSQRNGRPLSGDSFVPVAPEPMPRERSHKNRVRHQLSGDSFVPTAPEPLPLKEGNKKQGSRSSSHPHYDKPLPPLPPLPDSSNQRQTQQLESSERNSQHRRKGENILDEGEEITATKIAQRTAGKVRMSEHGESVPGHRNRMGGGKRSRGEDMTAREYSGSRRRAERISPGESVDVPTTSRMTSGKARMGEPHESAQEGMTLNGGGRGASDNVLRRRAERAKEGKKHRDYNITERTKYWGQ